MREMNMNFLEEYKSADNFIKDAFKSTDGITEYIRRMETANDRGIRAVATWRDDYRSLKHVRWVRNQLVHEVGYDSDICELNDLRFVKQFRTKLMKCEDPLALLEKYERAARKRTSSGQRTGTQKQTGSRTKKTNKKTLTLWQRIVKFFTEG